MSWSRRAGFSEGVHTPRWLTSENGRETKNILRVAIFAALLVGIHASAPAAQTTKPNVVLIFMDNFGWGELGSYGCGILRGAPTPRIRTLTSGGMRLLNFNVAGQVN